MAATLAVNSHLVTVFQVFEGAAEVAAAPVGFLRDLCCNCPCELRIVGEDHDAGSFIEKRQPSVSVCCIGFVLLNVHRASDRVSAKQFGCACVDEDSREVAVEDVSKAVQISLHRVAEGAPYRQTELISQNLRESMINL